MEEVGGTEALYMVHTTIIYTGSLPPRCGVTAQGCVGYALFQQETGTYSTWLGKTWAKATNRQGLTLTHSVLEAYSFKFVFHECWVLSNDCFSECCFSQLVNDV